MNDSLRRKAIRARGPDSGFTRFKVVIVVVILGALFAIGTPSLLRGLTPKSGCGPLPPWAHQLEQLWFAVFRPRIGCRQKPESDLRNILTVAEALYHVNGRYPETIEEMVNAKDENGADAVASLGDIPKDRWGSEYLYEIVDGRPRVTCLGSDKLPGGSDGEAMDIVRPEQQEGVR